MALKLRLSEYRHSKPASRKHDRGGEPAYVHTSKDGRKYIRSDEIIRLKQFQKQLDKLEKIVQGRA